jgi:hypothetical protein
MLNTYTTVDDAQAALEAAFHDYGVDEEGRDEVAFDLICSVAGLCTRAVAKEFCRRELGYVPHVLNVVHAGISREMEE